MTRTVTRLDHFLTAVLNRALDYHVGFEIVPLSPEQSPVVDTRRRYIILNSNWPKPKELAFQAAHELGHILDGDVGHFAYSNGCADTKVEGNANRTALSIVVPIYFDEIEQADANVEQFMDELAIPSWLHDASQTAISDFYSHPY